MKKIILILSAFFLLTTYASSKDEKYSYGEHELNFFTGMFDFSDKGKDLEYLDYNIKMKACLEIVS